MMMAQLYQENELNPLAGCLPVTADPGLHRALPRALSLAREDLLEESFLWIPNLEGPVFGAQNADWLFKFDNWNGAVPPLGWADTAAYLALPVLLVVAQSRHRRRSSCSRRASGLMIRTRPATTRSSSSCQ